MMALTLKNKLQNSQGETLVEALCSILIVVVAMSVLSTAILTSTAMDKKAKAADAAYVEEHNAAETEQWNYDAEMIISTKDGAGAYSEGVSYDIKCTGTGDALSAFRYNPTAEEE